MLPCPVCKRHIHASEASCPFCGARQGKTAPSGGLFVGMMVLASTLGGGAIGCAPGDVDLDEGSDTVGDTSAPMTTASTADEADEADEDWGEQGGSFYAGPADEEEGETGSPLVCNVFVQDCPEGEKCVAVMEGKDEASYSRECVPVVGEKAVGEACVHDGPALGTDDCDAWGSCWVEDSEGKGVCRAFCAGESSNPLCAQGTQCVVAHGDAVALCIEPCVPGGEPCPGEQSCEWVPVQADPGFACTLPPAGDPAGTPCPTASDLECDSGLACVDPPNPEQCAGNCCTEVCNVELPSCALEGAECVAFESPELASVGVCLIP